MAKHKPLAAVEVTPSPWQRFQQYLQSQGMRNTEQRRTLVEHIFAHHQHFDADQLLTQLPARGQPGYVSRPTVYRTLAEFVDAGLLRKFDLAGRAVYEVDYGYPQHDHLYCNGCHRLLEFKSEEVLRLAQRVAREQHFQVSGHRLLINGLCEQCAKR